MKNVIRFIFFFLIGFSSSSQLFAQEAKYKSLFMYKFIQNMKWPSTKSEGYCIISVMGDSELINELKQITSGRQVNGKSVRVIPYSKGQTLSDINILYIAKSKNKNFPILKDQALLNSLVVITESEGYAKMGASINFIKDGNRLKFELNESSLKKANIIVSDAIKKLAVVVK